MTTTPVTLRVVAKAVTIAAGTPASKTVSDGQAVTFTATVSGGIAPTYQWYSPTGAVSGATAASYTIPAASFSDAGAYHVVVSDATLSTPITSSTATLTVNPDAVVPAVTFTYPASKVQLTNNIEVINSTVTLAGTASDNVNVSQVFVSLNGAPYQAASVIDNPKVTSVKWSLPVTPAVGTNNVSAYSVDFAGESRV